ncbi:MAG: nucleotidyltransferase family protein [Thiomicrospira sp.]|uniref:N-acetylmuramate alpha-1-phosphate uridylyltransferase MurU n=1 Tax=Thiomicrospira sp. TaxID=935 RepID=UPI001A08F7C3|nr:nucleotidyltransferase family protein [Thiomicrospira sp.]MBE0494543.1 nucleotidyltransferase family protein [Thiomicrospira sp.]
MKAMILAAGRGERLRPLTDTCPKPLLPLNGKPLIVYHLEKLAQAGVQDVVINYAWLGEQFEKTLGRGEAFGLNIHYSPEPEGGLETAGGMIQALPLLDDEPFILINGDVFSYYDFSQLSAKLKPNFLAHLVLVPTPEFKTKGDFGLQPPGLVVAQGDWTFSGISVIDPKLLINYPVGRLALAPILREAMSRQLVSGETYVGLWSDIGTQERLRATEHQILNPC